jgi:hypothetical protein
VKYFRFCLVVTGRDAEFAGEFYYFESETICGVRILCDSLSAIVIREAERWHHMGWDILGMRALKRGRRPGRCYCRTSDIVRA